MFCFSYCQSSVAPSFPLLSVPVDVPLFRRLHASTSSVHPSSPRCSAVISHLPPSSAVLNRLPGHPTTPPLCLSRSLRSPCHRLSLAPAPTCFARVPERRRRCAGPAPSYSWRDAPRRPRGLAPSPWTAEQLVGAAEGSGAECVRCVPPSHAQPACVASRGGEAQEGTAAKLGGRLPS